MREPIPVKTLLAAVRRLAPDRPVEDHLKWYRSQHEHWIGWLSEYEGPGAYNRSGAQRDARFVYNHIVEPKMLLYLAHAAGVSREHVAAARQAIDGFDSLMRQSGTVRRILPWSLVARALWPSYVETNLKR